jgi:hypothetical protein
MTRQVTDNLYIDLEYFTPEEYYVYEAEASASVTAAVTMSTDVGVIKQGASTQTSAFDLSATISHIEGVDIVLSNFASFTLTPSVTREVATAIDSAFTAVAVTVAGNVQNASASFSSEFAQTTTVDRLVGASSTQSSSAEFAVDAVANRSAAITLDTIGNLDAQAARTRDYSSDLASAFTVTALSNSTLEFDAFLEYEIPDLFVDAVITAEGVITAGALFTPSITVEAFKNHTAILETTAALTVDAVKTASAVSTQDSAFAQAASAIKLVEAASAQSSEFAQTAAVSRTRPGVSAVTAVSTLTATARRVSRPGIGFALSTAGQITTAQSKFGGGSLGIVPGQSGQLMASVSPHLQADLGSFNWTHDFWHRQTFNAPGSTFTIIQLAPTGINIRLGYAYDGTTHIYRLQYTSFGGSTNTVTTTSPVSVPLNQFNHYRLTSQVFSSQTTNLTLWLNGSRILQASAQYLPGSTSSLRYFGVNGHNIDEIRLYNGNLTDKDTTSFTVPTQAFVNDNNTRYLLHLDTNVVDDNLLTVRSGAATISTAATLAVTATEIVSLSAALTSTASQSATATITRGANANLAANGFVVTVAGYLQDDVADLSAAFSAITNASAILVADTSASATSTLSLLGGRVQNADATVSAQFSATAQGLRSRLIDSALASEFTQTTDAVKTADAAVSVTESITVNSQGNLIAETISSANAQTQAVIDGSYTANGQADFEATGFVISVVAKTGLGAVDMQSQFALSCDTEVVYEQSASLAVTATLTSDTVKIIEFSTIETILGVTNNAANQSPTGPFLKLTQSETTANVGCFYVSAYLKDPIGYIFDSYPDASDAFVGSALRIETNFGIPSFYYYGENGTVVWQLSDEDYRTSLRGFHHYYLRVNTAETTNQLKYRLFFDGVEIPQSAVSGTDIVMRVSGTYNLMMETGFQSPYWRAVLSNSGYGDIGDGFGPAGMAQFVFDYKTSFNSSTFPVTDIEKVFPYQDLGTAGTDTGLAAPIQYINLENYTDLSNRGTLGGTYAWKQLSLVSGQNYNLNDFSASSSNDTVGFTNNIIAISSLTATAQSIQVVSAQMSAETALAATVAKTISAQATLDSAVTATADVRVTRTFNLSVDSNFALSVTAASTQDYAADFTTVSTLTADGVIESGAIVNLSISTTLAINAGLLAESTVSMHSESTLTANIDKVKDVLMTVASDCAVQATAIKTARAQGTLANTATLSAIIDRIPAFNINLSSEFAVQAQAKKTVSVSSTQQSQFAVSTEARKLVGFNANFTAFFSQLTVSRVINFNPYTTYVIPKETRAYKIRKESRLYTIDSESRIYNIKG